MDIKLNLFNTFDTKAFNNAVKFFASEKRRELVIKFQDYCANVMARTYEYGDIKHANKLAIAAELCGFGPTFRRVVVPVTPFVYDKKEKQFSGQIQKGKRSALSAVIDDPRKIPEWEAQMRANFDSEGSSKEKKDKDYLKALQSALAAALKHGITPDVVRSSVNSSIKAATAASDVPSGEAQAAIIKTKQARKAA